MTTRDGILTSDERVASLVVLTILARADPSACARVLQGLALRQVVIEQFVGDFRRFDHREVRGLEYVQDAVMRISVVVSLQHHADLQRLVKLLNRIVDVYKVEHTFRV